MDAAPEVVDSTRSGADPGPMRSARDPRTVVGALVVLLVLPLFVALVMVHRRHWYPLLDMAYTEIRVRDVATSHPPLIGLAGRIGPFGPNGGSHPGPVSFYALWPFWALFGRSSFGMLVGNVVLDVAAVSLALWMAFRRGGLVLSLAIAAALAVLMHTYGAYLLTLPWNPYLPVLWWFVFLLAVWSLLCGDLPMLPVAVFAGTFCLQTHISYAGLVGGLGAFAAIALVYMAFRGRRDASRPRDLWWWGAISLGLGVVLWIPPIIDQIVHSPGNLDVIRDYFTNPPSATIGVRRGVDVLLQQLDPWQLITHTVSTGRPQVLVSGSRVAGGLLLVAWVVSVLVARTLRHRALLRLDLVLAVALALGLASTARIFGDVFYYLLLWARGLSALLLLALGWTVVAFVRTRAGDGLPARAGARGVAVLVAVTVVFVALLTANAAGVDVQQPRLNDEVGALVPPTAAALTRMQRAGQGGPYLVTWLPDAQAIGSQGFGLLNALIGRGFDARAATVFRNAATRYHVIDPARASLEVHLAIGPDISRWRGDTKFVEVAAFDPRSEAERTEFDALHDQVAGGLGSAGLGGLTQQIDDNLFMLAIAPRVPDRIRHMIERMLEIGMPVAVFIGPPTVG